jgi:hypothetical protein
MRRISQPLVRLWRALLSSLDCGNFADCILRGFPCLDHDVIRSDLHASLAITDARTNCDDRDHSNESDQRDLELSRSICSQKRIVHRRSLTLVALPRPATYDLSTTKRDAHRLWPTDFQRSHRVRDSVRLAAQPLLCQRLRGYRDRSHRRSACGCSRLRHACQS